MKNYINPVSSRTAAGLIVILLLSACAAEDSHQEVHWGYDSHDGPQHWGEMSAEWALCTEGKQQSPIDLSDAQAYEIPPAVFDLPSAQMVEVLNQNEVIQALDNGHTIQINARTAETLTIGDKSYELLQFHFHAPSEHTLYGEHLPMEAHFVHQADDGELAVTGVLIAEGEKNPGVQPLWKHLHDEVGTPMAVQMPINFADAIFPETRSGVFHYQGSLTTPPCSEGVQWYIRQEPTEMSAEQIAEFQNIYMGNNRPVQPLGDRKLYLDESPNVTVR